jgi:hypothetical protein
VINNNQSLIIYFAGAPFFSASLAPVFEKNDWWGFKP